MEMIYKTKETNESNETNKTKAEDYIKISNVDFHWYHTHIIHKYNVIEYQDGHYLTAGKYAKVMKNPLWKIRENDKEYLLMYCETNTVCVLCPTSYQKILDFEQEHNNKKLTWFKGVNGYIHTFVSTINKQLSIHQIIMDCYGNGKGTKNISVDHIDQNPLNNSWDNLRIATRKEQEQNSKGIKEGTKRDRKQNAIELPNGIEQHMMKKYVVYYHEWLDKQHTREREFFKVETHPKLDKPWMTSKSNKVTIQDKLEQANKVVDDLENDIYPEKEPSQLPKYISMSNTRGKQHLVFEKKQEDNKRLNIKMVLPEEYDLEEQITALKTKIGEKYGEKIVNELFTPS